MKIRFPAVAILLLLTGPCLADSAAPIAPRIDDQLLQWSPDASYGKAVLTLVTPEGRSVTREFAPGEFIALDLSPYADSDGQFLYELSLLPEVTEEQRATLEGARAEHRSVDLGLSAQRWHGGFRRMDGQWLIGASSEATAGEALPDDETIMDVIVGDLSVQGSLCTGVDCLTAEVFGFDTFRLKENNLRINFEDTSNSGSFATGDWRIAINGSQNGDPSYFAIEDVESGTQPFYIEDATPSNTLRIDSSGHIGIGTPSPAVEVHVRNGDSPTLRLEQDNSSGFAAQTWDIVGNETNFFVRDVTNGSLLSFRIRPGAPQSSIDIAASGNVGIGTASPAAKLHVANGDLRVDGAVYQLSSRSAKTDLVSMSADHLLNLLSGLDLFSWRYSTADADDRHFGPTSEDFYRTFGLGSSQQHISVADMAGVALGAAQALQHELSEKERELEAVRARLARLEQLLESQQN
jgi:hypothetical protein